MLRTTSAVFVFTVLTSAAYGFPENIRLGYAGCQSCHVSPTGGGVLNGYGRSASSEFMTSFEYKDEGRFLHGLVKKNFDAIDVGGDVRYIKIEYAPKGGEPFKREFMMQADFELAVHLSSELTLVGLYGEYGEEATREFRRHYALWSPSDKFSLRFGRFYPAYGIMGADHTIQIRKHLGFGQGQESYNVEASLHGEKGEIFLTAIIGKEASVRLTKDQGYLASSSEKGAAARATLFFANRAQAGASAMYMQTDDGTTYTQAFGGFVSAAANEKLYGLAQYDVKSVVSDNSDPVNTSAGYLKIGLEVLRGVHLYGQAESTGNKETTTKYTGGGIQWFPRPHFELLGQFMSSDTSKTTYLMAHYYW